ncbi:MAG: hypothetical protein ACTSRL_05245 [Candidatus Helarchaeota archaeon]
MGPEFHLWVSAEIGPPPPRPAPDASGHQHDPQARDRHHPRILRAHRLTDDFTGHVCRPSRAYPHASRGSCLWEAHPVLFGPSADPRRAIAERGAVEDRRVGGSRADPAGTPLPV